MGASGLDVSPRIFEGRLTPTPALPQRGGSKSGLFSQREEQDSRRTYSFPLWGKVGMGACGA